ncbi:MAG TPA: hypothetical protein VLB76_05440 [Thermoanaerobaculia bacterium]|jgi:hypothetical protein|nr:hypothetical protein [Thermoanaerobaculia bacterium]
MGFENLKGREFTVRSADAGAKHAVDDIVTIEGSADKVEIKCKRYADGKYDNGTISDGTYTITITEDKGGYQIKFTPASQEGSGGIGGSWTANDSPPGPDNG